MDTSRGIHSLWRRISVDKTVVALRLTAVLLNAFFVFGNGQLSWTAFGLTTLAGGLYLATLLLGRWLSYRTLNLFFIPVDLILVTFGVSLTHGLASATYLVYFVEITIAALYAGFRASLFVSLAASFLYLGVLWPESVTDRFWWHYGYRAANLLLMGLGVGFLGHHLRQQVRALQARTEEAGRSLARARALSRLARQVNSNLDLDRVLDSILASAAQLVSVPAGAVSLADPDGYLRLKAVYGLDAGLIETASGHLSEWSHPGQTRVLRRADLVPALAELGLQGALEAPIAVDDTLVGTLLVLDRSPQRHFAEDEREALEALAGHAGVALGNARLYHDSRRRAEFLATVNKVGQSLNATLRPEELYPAIYREVSAVMPVEAFFVGLWEEEASLLHVKFHMDHKGRRAPYTLRLEHGPTVEAIQSHLPVLMDLTEDNLNQVTLVGDTEPTRSVLVVPLLAGDCVIGAMSAQSYQAHAYQNEHVELLSTIGGLAASALENARLYQRTLELSLTDPLTGLGNARCFHQQLDQELKRAMRYGHPVSLLMIDSDSLKSINDQFGHAVGDQHIRQLAQVVRESLRSTDLAARYAGDEFMVILPETALSGAVQLAERIRQGVEQIELSVGSGRVHTTVSIGVASFPSQAAGSDDLIRIADSAMYLAKQGGKNRVAPAGPLH